MSTAIIFDALTHSRRLQEVDVPTKQANIHAELMADFVSKQSTYLATKADLKELSVATKADLKELSVATKADLKELNTELNIKIEKLDGKIEKVDAKLNTMLGLFSAFIALFGISLAYTQYISQKSPQNSLPPTVKASTFKVG